MSFSKLQAFQCTSEAKYYMLISTHPILFLKSFVLAAILLNSVDAAPVPPQDTPKPSESSYYSTYRGKSVAYPANITKTAILPTKKGEADHEDLLFQDLMSAEWAIYSFYQQGVERSTLLPSRKLDFPTLLMIAQPRSETMRPAIL
jgi:hypothetical protein